MDVPSRCRLPGTFFFFCTVIKNCHKYYYTSSFEAVHFLETRVGQTIIFELVDYDVSVMSLSIKFDSPQNQILRHCRMSRHSFYFTYTSTLFSLCYDLKTGPKYVPLNLKPCCRSRLRTVI